MIDANGFGKPDKKPPLQLHKYRLTGDLAQDIADVLEKYTGKVSLAETLGVLDIIKHDLLASAHEDQDG